MSVIASNLLVIFRAEIVSQIVSSGMSSKFKFSTYLQLPKIQVKFKSSSQSFKLSPLFCHKIKPNKLKREMQSSNYQEKQPAKEKLVKRKTKNYSEERKLFHSESEPSELLQLNLSKIA